MKLTYHSEYGTLKSVYLKKIESAFADQKTISEQWKDLNYLSGPDLESGIKEYAEFQKRIESVGADIKYFDHNESLSMDSVYCRDASIATDFGIILCNMGKEARTNEPEIAKKIYQKNGEKILGMIQYPGTLEGGDVAWLNDKTLAVGRTYRTNHSGIEQLRNLLEPHGVTVVQADLPHYKGQSDVFHLMSILSPVDKDLAVVYSPLMPIPFRELLLDLGYSLVEVPDEEFESMGCNVLALSPRNCLMVAGNPSTKKRLEVAGATVHEYSGNEISVKGGGGPTCLTRPMLREI
jgi:N-dimethylarginine dimethylaminohydrolase